MIEAIFKPRLRNGATRERDQYPKTITSNEILESVSEIEQHTGQGARASIEQQTAIGALGVRVQKSSNLTAVNADAITGMKVNADNADPSHLAARTRRPIRGQSR